MKKIAIEWVSYSWKTSVIENLSLNYDNIFSITEYSKIWILPDFPRLNRQDILQSAKQIINLEHKRENIYKETIKSDISQSIFLLLDRSWISCLAFEYILQKNWLYANVLDLAKRFDDEFDNDYLAIDHYVNIQNTYSDIIKRENFCIKNWKWKNIDFFRDESIICAVAELLSLFRHII